ANDRAGGFTCDGKGQIMDQPAHGWTLQEVAGPTVGLEETFHATSERRVFPAHVGQVIPAAVRVSKLKRGIEDFTLGHETPSKTSLPYLVRNRRSESAQKR